MPKQPHPEHQYFGKMDALKKRKIAEEKRLKLAKEELDKLKEKHWRRCAQCGFELDTVIFKGTTVHKCFNCGGVFMEDGVLEKLCGEESHILESILDIFKC